MAITEINQVEAQGLALVEDAARLQIITDAPMFARAGEFLRLVKTYLRQVDEITGPVIAAAHATHKAAVAQRTTLSAHAEQAEKIVKRAMGAYEEGERRRRQEEERRAEEARRQAEAEARRLAAIAEAAARQAAEDRMLAEAAEAEARGDSAAAERIIEAPVPVVPIMPPMPTFSPPPSVVVPQADGVSFRDSWRAEVRNLGALVRAIAGGQVPLTLVVPEMKALNAMARALKGEMRIPGVTAVSERTASVR